MSKATGVVLTAVVLVMCAVSMGWSQTASVVIVDHPQSVQEDKQISVDVAYSSDLQDYALKARIFLEVIDADTGAILETQCLDRKGDFYDDPSGVVSFKTNVSGVNAVYFNAYISPIEFNSYFVQELQSYPTDGTYPYKWTGNGVTHSIYYKGSLILSDNVAGNWCYCSGITYQIFMDAYEKYNNLWGHSDICGMTVNQMIDFRREWYGWYSIECAIAAIKKYRVGYEIPYQHRDRLIPGDDVQLWRASGSGHSVVFINWVYDENNEISGINYWSSQSATKGIGYRTEYFGKEGSLILKDKCFYARKVKPLGPDDWLNRYGDANTAASPTIILPFTED
jgi:hypothetical protein